MNLTTFFFYFGGNSMISWILEHTSNDRYWGDGGDGKGKNMLGITLMAVRTKIAAMTPEEIAAEVKSRVDSLEQV